MINSIRVSNLRTLKNVPPFHLTDINVLVGKNSSGKSTFARIFPLLRQSIEAETKGPILWYGRFVDFGSFEESLNLECEKEEITFDFSVPLQPINNSGSRGGLRLRGGLFNDYLVSDSPTECKFQLTLKVRRDEGQQKAPTTYVSRFFMKLFDTEIEFSANSLGEVSTLRVGEYRLQPNEDTKILLRLGALLPNITIARKRRFKTAEGREITRLMPDSDYFARLIDDEIASHVHGNTTEDRRISIAQELELDYDSKFFERVNHIEDAPESWYRTIRGLNSGAAAIRRLKDFTFARGLSSVIMTLDNSLRQYFTNTRYIEPLRATAQRYYRRQDLAVDEIDSKGTNVAMFLNSLSSFETADFERWMDGIFGAHISAASESGHISLRYMDKDDTSSGGINISDVGFGFSQVLPLAVQLWSAAYRPSSRGSRRAWLRDNETYCIVIEQPELHLHPEFQARISNMLVDAVNVARERNNTLNVIVETHSPSIINRLGELIASDKIEPKKINVGLFEKLPSSLSSSVRSVQFDCEGVLEDWPYGFFEPR